VAFVLASSLMIVYDLGILVAFWGHKSQEQNKDEELIDSAQTEEIVESRSTDGNEKKLEVTIDTKELESSAHEKEEKDS